MKFDIRFSPKINAKGQFHASKSIQIESLIRPLNCTGVNTGNVQKSF